MPELTGVRPADAVGALLTRHARELYDDLRLVPLLGRLIQASCQLTGAAGGSISIVGPDRTQYTKAAERGTSCRLGQNFPLEEGVTGLVVRERRAVVLPHYRDVLMGHVPEGNLARDRAVAAIPIWWRGDIIAVNVVFAGPLRQFTSEEIDQLEVLTQLVAPGLVAAAARDLSLNYLANRRSPFSTEPLGDGDGAGTASVAKVAMDLLGLTDRAAQHPGIAAASLHVAVLPSDTGLRLLVKLDPLDGRSTVLTAPDPHHWQELVDRQGGGVDLLELPVHETVTGPDWPTPVLPPETVRLCEPSPFSPREKQVAGLLARGLKDRVIADTLVISPKTVEKHVGAVLRKTGTTGRTAAVMHALAAGWLDDGPTRDGPSPADR